MRIEVRSPSAQKRVKQQSRQADKTSLGRLSEVLLDDTRSFLDLRGTFKVGPGDPVKDLREARKRMGTERA
jgi:hypothetical protein